MRIVIDLQGAQSESRFRGIGRYSLALALGIARNAGDHEVWLVLNGALGQSIAPLRAAFKDLVPRHRIRVFDAPGPVAELAAENSPRARNAEALREYFIAQLHADVVLVTSLFEGLIDDAVTSVGSFSDPGRTAVVLYDLIPLLNPDSYLGSDLQRAHYGGKIASLERAGLLLAISDYSRQEAIDALAFPAARVVAISTAVDPQFRPATLTPAQRDAIGQRFGIERPYVMYAPGGFDPRKNIDGMITAFSLLPPALRADHQLVLASKIDPEQRRTLLRHASSCGLDEQALIITGYVSDAELVDLYRGAALFVFPSHHEGFGLPALEAMACGAAVIGANNTSIPEVIGCTEALFDGSDPHAIAAKMAQVLGDQDMQSRLLVHGREQAARFSWDISARRALAAMEQQFDVAAAPAAPARTRRRLAFVSPLPPERTGIADYAVQLLPALRAHFDIELVLQQDRVSLPAGLDDLPRRSVAWFSRHAGDFDQILYQFGNSPFHSHMFALLAQHPGVVVLHDFFLGDVLAYEQMSGAMPTGWTDALYHSHGYAAAHGSVDAAQQAKTKEQFPCNLAVLQDATAVIVHSGHPRELAQQWYGAGATDKWNVVPLPRSAPLQQQRAAARRTLGLPDDAFIVCTFGFIAPTKMSAELVQAWRACPLHADPSCILVLVGQNHGGEYGIALSAAIAAAGAQGRIRIAGWTDDSAYHAYLQAADVGVQLRSVSRGETSAAVLDCMNYGLATIVNANGSMASLPDDSVLKLPDQFDLADLSKALTTLRNDAALRANLGQRAAELLHTAHSPANCAQRYADILDGQWQRRADDRQALIARLASLPDLDELALQQLAWSVARLPDPLAPRQLLVDVTAIARHDLKTGIERVVRTQVRHLLEMDLPGLRVEPVYLSDEGGRWHYRYARQYVRRTLGLGAGFGVADSAIDIACNDIFYSADYSPGAVLAAAASGLYEQWRARGVAVHFVVYDLLPVLRPDFFPPHADATHGPWLSCISAQADQLICISAAVKSELQAWLGAAAPDTPQAALCSLHLGADISAKGAPSAAPLPAGAADLLRRLRSVPTFLMVGTIEPRKGHLQAIAAFDLLRQQGIDVNLVIVGNEGWTPLAPAQRRTIPAIVSALEGHAELGERLHWLRGVEDDFLQQLYEASACLLVPSEGEGFGLPLIEAAHNDLPVIARDLPVFREVAGDAAYYFSGSDGAALAATLTTWLQLHADGQTPQPQHMQSMTWREHCEQLVKLLLAV